MTEYILPPEGEIEDSIINSLIVHAFFVVDKHTPSDEGADYKSLYCGLYRGITYILRNTTTYEQIIDSLKQLQIMADDAYTEQGE